MPLTHNFTASPPNHLGWWSPQTSAVNFCEIDYAVTPYVAEFVNSVTNLVYVWYAVRTLPIGRSRSRTSSSSSPEGTGTGTGTGSTNTDTITDTDTEIQAWDPSTWPLTNLSLLCVGIFSGLFHVTLKHQSQIADEIAMYAIVSSLNYAVYTSGPNSLKRPLHKLLFGAVLLNCAAGVSYSNYVDTGHVHYGRGLLDIHTSLFVVLLSMFWPRMLYLINRGDGSGGVSGRDKDNASKKGDDAVAATVRRRRLRTFRASALAFVLGFGIWCVDGLYCDQLRGIRAQMGLPWAWALEGHGIWHVLTAMGAGGFVGLVGELVDEMDDNRSNEKLKGEGEAVGKEREKQKVVNGGPKRREQK